MSTKCTAITAAGHQCKNWAMIDLDPPLCGAHRGLLGAQPGNQNAVKHAFYRRTFTPTELADLLAHAQNTTLADELAVSRVMLQRLMDYLKSPDCDREDLAAVGPLIFTGSRTIAYLLRESKQNGRHNIWDDVLDDLADKFDIDL